MIQGCRHSMSIWQAEIAPCTGDIFMCAFPYYSAVGYYVPLHEISRDLMHTGTGELYIIQQCISASRHPVHLQRSMFLPWTSIGRQVSTYPLMQSGIYLEGSDTYVAVCGRQMQNYMTRKANFLARDAFCMEESSSLSHWGEPTRAKQWQSLHSRIRYSSMCVTTFASHGMKSGKPERAGYYSLEEVPT